MAGHMPALRLLGRLTVYYGVLGLIVWALLAGFPTLDDYLPVGRAQTLLAHAQGQPLPKGLGGIAVGHTDSFWGSIFWMASAMVGALATALPVSWTYMAVRNHEEYDQSMVGAIVLMPLVITSIVVIVQNSLALSFSLAGIVGAVRFRNSLKSTGDLLFTLMPIGIGISSGIGAVELAAVSSIMFNLAFVALWASEYGERQHMKRFLSDYDPDDEESRGTTTTTVEVAAVKVSTTTEPRADPEPPKPAAT